MLCWCWVLSPTLLCTLHTVLQFLYFHSFSRLHGCNEKTSFRTTFLLLFLNNVSFQFEVCLLFSRTMISNSLSQKTTHKKRISNLPNAYLSSKKISRTTLVLYHSTAEVNSVHSHSLLLSIQYLYCDQNTVLQLIVRRRKQTNKQKQFKSNQIESLWLTPLTTLQNPNDHA